MTNCALVAFTLDTPWLAHSPGATRVGFFACAQYALFALAALVELVTPDVPREACEQLERDAFVELELRKASLSDDDEESNGEDATPPKSRKRDQ